jgi:hypothetical protein
MVVIAASLRGYMLRMAGRRILCSALRIMATAITTAMLTLKVDMLEEGVYIAAMVLAMARKHHSTTRHHSRDIQREQRKRHSKTKYLS